MDLTYNSGGGYIAGGNASEGKGVHELRRPKSLYEVNKNKKTPYTEQIHAGPNGCQKKMGNHYYLAFSKVFDPRRGKLFCRRDGTQWFDGIFSSQI